MENAFWDVEACQVNYNQNELTLLVGSYIFRNFKHRLIDIVLLVGVVGVVDAKINGQTC